MKRFIYTLACLVLSIGAWAQTTLQEQINAADDGATITLTENVSVTSQIEISGKSVILDLNGKTVEYTGTTVLASGVILVHNGAGLTVNASGGGSVISGNKAYAAIAVTKKGDSDANPARLTINGGNFEGYYYAIVGNGARHNTEITINDGTFKGLANSPSTDDMGLAIFHPQEGKLTINGGEFEGPAAGVEIRAGELNISGGSFKATATEFSEKWNGSGSTVVGAALAISQHSTNKDIKVNITGGTFDGLKAVYEVDLNTATGDKSDNIDINIEDGTFNGGVASENVRNFVSGGTFNAPVPEDYCANDFKPTDDGSGHYGVIEKNYVAQIGDKKYESLAEAISAAQNGETIILLSDATENIIVPADKNIILDLNGKTLSGGSVASNGNKAAIVNNGTITIQDSSAEQTGTIKREDDDTGLSASKSYYVIDNQGTMTIKSGNVMNKAGVPGAHKGSSLIRNGEVAEGAVLNIEGGTLSQDNFDVIKNGGKNSVLNITGGTINSVNSYAILSYDKVNMSAGTITGKVCFRSYTDATDDCHGVGNISGGTINGNITVETYPGNTPNTLSECNISGDAIINGNLSIGEGNGNTFTANDEKGTIAVSGGTFNNAVQEQYCAVGYIPTDDGNGNYTVKEGAYIARISEQGYETLAEAVAAAQNGETITLLANTIENVTIPAGKNITLELNGMTLSGGTVASNGKKAAIVNYGTLTIQDSSEEKTGTVKREDDDTELSASNSYYVIDNQGVMTIKSGSITNKAGVPGAHKGSSLIRNGEIEEGAVLNIEGGTLTQDNFDVIKNGGKNSVLYIMGGTINSANSYAVLSYDVVNMTGGEVNGKVCFRSYSDSDGDSYGVGNITGGTINGDITVETYPGNTPNTLSKCNVSDAAVINGTLSIGVGNGTTFEPNDENGTIAVSGGTFNAPVPEKYCAEGYIPEDNGNGTYGVKEGSYIARIGEQGYETLDEAIEAAKQTETDATITLLDDAETTKEALPENVTIDANGKVLTMPSFVVLDGLAYTLPNITGAVTYKVHKATYIRTNISETEWGTVCLPFSLTSGNGATYYTFNNISGNTLTVDETATVNPHTPVVFNKTAGDLEINETNAIVSLVTPGELKNGALIGTYTSAAIPADGNIYFINGDRFHQVQASLSVPMYRAYINNASSGGAKPRVLSIVVNEDATAIDVVDADANAEIIAIYDASGRKLNAPQKGMNIMKLQNGKTVKLLVK